jgi:hypothetical protein
MQSRRAALLTLSTAALSPLLAQHPGGGHTSTDDPSAAQRHDPVFFSKPDFAVISKLADLIIPRTDTPGALDANVPYRIDQEVSAKPALQPIFRDGLAAVANAAQKAGTADFLSLSEAQQTAILTNISEAETAPDEPFFRALKDLTIDWYYRSEQGLVTELGFHGNTFRPNFPGCTHPEHWPTQAVSEAQK